MKLFNIISTAKYTKVFVKNRKDFTETFATSSLHIIYGLYRKRDNLVNLNKRNFKQLLLKQKHICFFCSTFAF